MTTRDERSAASPPPEFTADPAERLAALATELQAAAAAVRSASERLHLTLARTQRLHDELGPSRARRPAVRPCVLLVEEDAGVREALAGHLRLHGLDVHGVPDGAAALAAADAAAPDLALVHLGLPDMDGVEVGRRLRERDAASVLVALTRRGAQAEVRRCRAAGFDRLVVKPLHVDVLRELLRLVAARRRGAGG